MKNSILLVILTLSLIINFASACPNVNQIAEGYFIFHKDIDDGYFFPVKFKSKNKKFIDLNTDDFEIGYKTNFFYSNKFTTPFTKNCIEYRNEMVPDGFANYLKYVKVAKCKIKYTVNESNKPDTKIFYFSKENKHKELKYVIIDFNLKSFHFLKFK